MSSKTPPALKWALNERAALAGEAARLSESCRYWLKQLTEVQARITALDTTIAILDARVRSDAAGTVHAHAGKYGEHGALKAFLQDTLQASGATGLSTSELVQRASTHFGLVFASPRERAVFASNSLTRRLRHWEAEGKVEALHGGVKDGRPGVWRWKQSDASLDQLHELARLAAAGG